MIKDKCPVCKKRKKQKGIWVCRTCKKVLEPLLYKAFLKALGDMIDNMSIKEAFQYKVYVEHIKKQ